jgi:D-glycero-beta-D-manno-heptose-7-phosphate kinase
MFQEFSTKNVLIIGDVMIDRYVKGSVSRISPEAPVPVLEWKETQDRLGGAANVALNVKALGAKPYLLGVVGNDEDGQVFKQLLVAENIESQHLVFAKNRPTTVKTRMMAAGQQLLRLDKEVTDELGEFDAFVLYEKIKYLIENQKVSVVIFQDYNKGVLSKTLIEQVLSLTEKHQIPSCIDPKKDNFTAYKNATLFKPNLKEISVFLGEKVAVTLESLQAATARFRAVAPCKNMMITLSEKGIFIDGEGVSMILPTSQRHIADVCGAGDTVIAVASVALASGVDLATVAKLCNIAGGQVCEEIGVVPIKKDKFLNEFLGQ